MTERSADPLDMASLAQEQANDIARAAMKDRLKPQRHPDFDGEHCLVCEDDMPPERLAAGRIRCTACETNIEKRR